MTGLSALKNNGIEKVTKDQKICSQPKKSIKEIKLQYQNVDQQNYELYFANNYDTQSYKRWRQRYFYIITIVPITFVLFILFLLTFPFMLQANYKLVFSDNISCNTGCKISLVESIPINMTYDNNSILHQSTYSTWLNLINSAENTIEIGSLYWTMKRNEVYPDSSAKEGEDVLQNLYKAGKERGIKLKIAQNAPSHLSPNTDTQYLEKNANAEVRSLNFNKLLGGGVLHTKLWLIDRKHFYVGSANMDWRSLTQVKELGVVGYNCTCIAHDLSKIFDVYWLLGAEEKIPPTWPKEYSTKVNINNPMSLEIDGNKYKTFSGSSPPAFSPQGRTDDIDGLVNCINNAKKFVYISVMDYIPLTIYSSKPKFWPIIGNALKTAAIERKVNIRLLISKWKHSRKSINYFLKSLEDLSDSLPNVKIEVKRMVVPSSPELDKIPYGRVNHNKYMVTDAAAYIGTSNWSGDYFIDTAGIGMVFEDADSSNNNSIRQQLEDVFLRDWNSPYVQDNIV